MWQVKTILYPTDFSPSSEETLHAACQLAHDRNARLIALHVVPKSVVKHVEGVSELPPEQAREKLWEAMRRPRPEEKELNVEHRIEKGDPAQGILRVAEETQCELIVMGMHGKSGWARWLMGGVAETVIQNAPCSVLIVKPLGTAQAERPVTERSAEKTEAKKIAKAEKIAASDESVPASEKAALAAGPAQRTGV